jgi:hypothetical protein
MKCYEHPTVEAVATCSNCGKAICQNCSIDVTGRYICQRCVASGNIVRFQTQTTKPTNGLAIVGLVFGILSLFGGLPFSIIAWITSHIAKRQISENPNQEGIQYANVGKGLGMVITILWGIFLICYFGLALVSLILGLFSQQ